MSLDPFRSRQVPEVAARFQRERARQQRHADLMWLGVMAAMFSDHELRLLDDLGFLCPHDRDLLRQAGRHMPDGGQAVPTGTSTVFVPNKPKEA